MMPGSWADGSDSRISGTRGGTPQANGEGQMGRRVTGVTALVPILLVTLLAGCAPRVVPPQPTPTTPVSPEASESADVTDVTEHESGPESPIAYGFQVPRGASQVGPLVRYRSDRLLRAYQTELETAQARRDADWQRRCDEREARGDTPVRRQSHADRGADRRYVPAAERPPEARRHGLPDARHRLPHSRRPRHARADRRDPAQGGHRPQRHLQVLRLESPAHHVVLRARHRNDAEWPPADGHAAGRPGQAGESHVGAGHQPQAGHVSAGRLRRRSPRRPGQPPT